MSREPKIKSTIPVTKGVDFTFNKSPPRMVGPRLPNN